jgi:3-hydroxyisobutyrate dehydrogenase
MTRTSDVTNPVPSHKVGFIGLGIMGKSMAGHLLTGGHELHVFSRTRAKAEDLLAKGAMWHTTPSEIASICDVVITMVGYPHDVEALYLGADGLIARTQRGSILIDMTTSSPSLAQRVAEAGLEHGCHVLDAPVSGGDVGARNAKLAIMVGGDPAALERVMPLLALMGSNIVHQGAAGAGQHTKMANRIAIASTMMAVSESLAYAKHAGLDAKRVLSVIGTGAAASFLLNNLGPKMLDGDFAPGFFVRHFLKDMEIAIAEADRMELMLPGLTQAKTLYSRLIEGGFEDEGTQALFRLYAGVD